MAVVDGDRRLPGYPSLVFPLVALCIVPGGQNRILQRFHSLRSVCVPLLHLLSQSIELLYLNSCEKEFIFRATLTLSIHVLKLSVDTEISVPAQAAALVGSVIQDFRLALFNSC